MVDFKVKIQTTDDLDGLASIVNILLYGPAGIGKTTALAGCPSPILISAEGGLLSLRGQGVSYIEVRNLGDLREVCRWLDKSKEAEDYETVCMDSLSEICDLVFHECRRDKLIGSEPSKLYPAVRGKVLPTLSMFRAFPKHFVATAHEFTKVLKGHDADILMPGVVGSRLADDLPYVFDLVLHYTIRDGNRVVLTTNDQNSVAKDRTGFLPPVIPGTKTFLGSVINLCLTKGNNTQQQPTEEQK